MRVSPGFKSDIMRQMWKWDWFLNVPIDIHYFHSFVSCIPQQQRAAPAPLTPLFPRLLWELCSRPNVFGAKTDLLFWPDGVMSRGAEYGGTELWMWASQRGKWIRHWSEACFAFPSLDPESEQLLQNRCWFCNIIHRMRRIPLWVSIQTFDGSRLVKSMNAVGLILKLWYLDMTDLNRLNVGFFCQWFGSNCR